jgi:hypothetical protein
VTTGWVNVGTIPAGFTARVEVEGKLTFTPNASYQLCAGSAPPPLPGGLSSVGPAGFPNGFNSYAVLVEYAGTQPPQTGGHRLAPTDPTASVMTEIKQGPAVVWAWRPSVLPYACGSAGVTQPAYFVSGSQSVTLETLDSAYLRADRGEAYVGEVVTFTIVPPAWGTSARAFGWRWVTDSSSAPVSGCGDALECRVPVVTSGTMIATVVVNGVATYSPRGTAHRCAHAAAAARLDAAGHHAAGFGAAGQRAAARFRSTRAAGYRCAL